MHGWAEITQYAVYPPATTGGGSVVSWSADWRVPLGGEKMLSPMQHPTLTQPLPG